MENLLSPLKPQLTFVLKIFSWHIYQAHLVPVIKLTEAVYKTAVFKITSFPHCFHNWHLFQIAVDIFFQISLDIFNLSWHLLVNLWTNVHSENYQLTICSWRMFSALMPSSVDTCSEISQLKIFALIHSSVTPVLKSHIWCMHLKLFALMPSSADTCSEISQLMHTVKTICPHALFSCHPVGACI